MSGTKPFGFIQGDRSEYLAYYLLSSIGLPLPVLRQADIGIDFYCNISDNSKTIVTFNFPFSIQMKSHSNDSSSKISYGGLAKDGRWKKEEIDWLFKQEIPFFIGLVDKDRDSLHIYSTSSIWFAFHEHSNCTQVSLIPRLDENNTADIGRPTTKKLDCENAKGQYGDGNECLIDMGLPIIKMDIVNIKDDNKVKTWKEILTRYIELEQRNIVMKKMKAAFFWWNLNSANYVTAWVSDPTWKTFNLDSFLEQMIPSVLALVLYYKAHNKIVELEKLKGLLEIIPKEKIPIEIRENYLKEIYTQIK